MELRGVERWLVFSRLRAWLGERLELPLYVRGLHLPADGRYLEIGAGLGWGAVGLVRRLGLKHVVTTDYDGRVLGQARRWLAARPESAALAWAQVDARRLPFADGVFDGVFAFYVLHHVGGYRPALQEIRRVLRPDGVFLFVDLVRPGWLPLPTSWVPPEGLYSPAQLRATLEQVGLMVKVWRGIPGVWAVVMARGRSG